MMKRQKISAEDAVRDILRFVYSNEETDDIDDKDDLVENDLNRMQMKVYHHFTIFPSLMLSLELMNTKNVIMHGQYLQH